MVFVGFFERKPQSQVGATKVQHKRQGEGGEEENGTCTSTHSTWRHFMFNSQEPWIEYESHENLHDDFTVEFSTYHGRHMAKFTYGAASRQFTGTDGHTIQAVAKNPTEKLVRIVEMPTDKKQAESMGCIDARLYHTHERVVTPNPKSAWQEPNIYDCLYDSAHNYSREMQQVLGLNFGAFYEPKLHYVDEDINNRIMDQACLVRRQQLFIGLETQKLQLKEDDDQFSDFPLFEDKPAYRCEVQVDLDHGDIIYVGQEVELKGHMVYVAGQREKYPPIRWKVRI